ncbi:Mini-ribonuclease 3, partial [Pseudomonas aeruginosa]|nr:Mini-ribonuclease 3 [Pseudomonas aeruginosa]
FEAIMGYLDMMGQKERLEELIRWCIEYVEKQQLISS